MHRSFSCGASLEGDRAERVEQQALHWRSGGAGHDTRRLEVALEGASVSQALLYDPGRRELQGDLIVAELQGEV